MPGLGAVPGRIGWVNDRAELVRAVLGRTAGGELSSVVGSWEPELRRRWGGPSPLGDCGIIARASVCGGELAADRGRLLLQIAEATGRECVVVGMHGKTSVVVTNARGGGQTPNKGCCSS
jgi:hypothetical protein